MFLTLTVSTAWGETYNFSNIPTSGWKKDGGSQTINGKDWTYSSSTYIGVTSSKIQIGSKNDPQTTDWTISAPISRFGTNIKITKVSITANTTATTATYDISVGGSSVKSGSLTTSSSTYSSNTLNTTTGNIVVTLKGSSSSKAMYLSNIAVTYETIAATTYTVTYDKNGATSGSVPTDATSYTSGATVTVKSNSGNLAKTGYTFGGWNTNTSGTGTNYTAGSGTFKITANTTLYAKWTVNTHTLTWNVNGGNDLTGTYTQGTVAYGTTITKPSDPTRTGHTFKGWSIDGTNIVTPASTMPDNDLTYIALWTPLTQHTVKWMVNGIEYTEGNPTASVYEGAKWSSLTLPAAPNPNDYCGQVFAGWTTTNIGSTGLDKDNDATAIQNLNLMTSENKSSKTNTITEPTTFYAVFADYAD